MAFLFAQVKKLLYICRVKQRKKMESKYYTPTLEEICVDLECQVKYDNQWKERKIRHSEDLCEIASRYTTDRQSIRVKYLDEKDFEDLNFTIEFATISTILETACKIYKNEILNVQIAHYKDLNKISVCTIDFSKNKTKSSWDENQINMISIKNKTELKKLLTQIEHK